MIVFIYSNKNPFNVLTILYSFFLFFSLFNLLFQVKVSTSQSTSQDIVIDCDPKCDGKELHLFKDLPRDKKSNLEKGTHANFCSPEPYVPLPVTSHIEKCDNLNCDKQLNNKHGILLNREMISVVNNTAPHITGLEDILKEAKTSNLNVLVTKEESNNELRYLK